MDTVKNLITSMSAAKMNVLHIHMSDEQSFPMEVKSYPKLWGAAFSEQERYTQADLASLVEYGRLRGIRMMVEFDLPGHSKSWVAGYPEVGTTCTAHSGSTLPLNVARNATFDLMESLLTEMTGGAASTTGSAKGLFPVSPGTCNARALDNVFFCRSLTDNVLCLVAGEYDPLRRR